MLNPEKAIINLTNLTSNTPEKNNSNNNFYQPIILVLFISSCFFACSRLFSCMRARNSSPQLIIQNRQNNQGAVGQLVFLEGEQNII
jgi:hypothetical protein